MAFEGKRLSRREVAKLLGAGGAALSGLLPSSVLAQANASPQAALSLLRG